MVGNKKIVLRDITGCQYAVSSVDGDRVHQQIIEALEDNDKVIVSFERLDLVAFAFLNAAIGRLYGKYSEAELDRRLSYINTSDLDISCIDAVIVNSLRYYEDPERYRRMIEEAEDLC